MSSNTDNLRASHRRHAAAGGAARVLRAIVALVLLLPAFGAAPRSQEINAERAARVKAAYLYNFAKFVRWPAHAHQGETDPIVIGLLGDDPFGTILDRSVRNKTVGARAITIRRIRSSLTPPPVDSDELQRLLDEIRGCHMLYICQSESGTFPVILEHVDREAILTVSDVESFARRGGMVEFVLDETKIVLHINRTVVESCELSMSSKLLNVSTIVETEAE